MAEAAERVNFDFEGSLELARKLYALSESIEADATARETDYTTAKAKWKGAYGDEFVTRREDERSKEVAAINQLRSEADLWASAWAQAMTQQNKNNRAAKVEAVAKQKSDDRPWYEKGSDAIGFTDDDSWEKANNEVPAARTVEVPKAPSYAATATEQKF